MIPIKIEFIYNGDINKLLDKNVINVTRNNISIPIIYIEKIDLYHLNIFLQGELMIPIDLSNYHKRFNGQEINMILKVKPGSENGITERLGEFK